MAIISLFFLSEEQNVLPSKSPHKIKLVDFGDLSAGVLTQWGENNTIALNLTNTTLISAGGTGATLGSIERNFSGFVNGVGVPAVNPGLGGGVSPGLWDAGGITSYSTNTTYTATTANTRTAETSISGVSCSGGFTTKGNGNQPLTNLDNTDTCKRWLGWIGIKPTSPDEYKMQYDTLHHYIESCGKNDDSYQAFSGMDGAVQFISDDTTRFIPYRNWLISVLYLNTTQPFYFCDCMLSIAGTYQYGKYNPLGYLAVLKYLLSLPNCDESGLEKEYKNDSTYDQSEDYDPTHLPSLDSLGLGFLLNAVVAPPSTPLSSQYLASFTSSPNPFIGETSLEFTLNRMSYVTLAVYDELGRLVWGYPGSSLEAGMHEVHIDGRSLPSGTLYARIATGFGEVKTVKLVHEK